MRLEILVEYIISNVLQTRQRALGSDRRERLGRGRRHFDVRAVTIGERGGSVIRKGVKPPREDRELRFARARDEADAALPEGPAHEPRSAVRFHDARADVRSAMDDD